MRPPLRQGFRPGPPTFRPDADRASGLPLARPAPRGRNRLLRSTTGAAIAFEDDHARDLDLRGLGYDVLRFTETQLAARKPRSPGCSPSASAATRAPRVVEWRRWPTTPHELFLIDGNSLAYRAFFALPESIATSDGRPTNAIYGLASMLVKIIDEHHPAGVVVAWDAGMSGREVTYDLYKAQRKPRPDLLREQWPHLMPLVEAFGYTNVKVEGYEADDVIASLARQAREEGIPVMVVTGDRDAYQLVGDGIRVMSTSRGITETKIYDREAVIERYGVPPELVTDLMGLRGDTSDNIPGVPGIGEKTAAQLLQKFGSLEEVLANVDEISGAKRKQNLVEHADDARMSKQLATLQYDIETGVDLAAAMASEPDRGALRDFMREFELRAVHGAARRGAAGGRRGARPQGRDRARGRGGRGRRPADLARGPGRAGDRRRALGRRRRRADRHRRRRATTSSRSRSPAGRSPPTTPSRSAAAATACSPPPPARASSCALDHDTMLAAYLLEPQRRTYELVELAADAGIGLAEGARRRADDEDDGQLALGEEGEAGLDPAEEARLVAALAERPAARGSRSSGLEPLLREVELPLVEVLAAMEREGLKLDAERLAEVGAGFGERIDDPGEGDLRAGRARSSRSARRSRSAASSSRSSG